jgi:hypothetical protein
MTNTMTALSRIAEDHARAAVVRRELAMLRAAQPHLRGIPARHNLARIAAHTDELNTLDMLIELTDRIGADELARCDAAAMEVAA